MESDCASDGLVQKEAVSLFPSFTRRLFTVFLSLSFFVVLIGSIYMDSLVSWWQGPQEPLLHLAVRNPDASPAMVKGLIKSRVNLDVRDASGDTALMTACTAGNLPVIELLVDSGAKVNSRGLGKRTALFCAAKAGHDDIVRFLLSKGADPTLYSENHMYSLAVEPVDKVKAKACNHFFAYPWHVAVGRCSLPVVEALFCVEGWAELSDESLKKKIMYERIMQVAVERRKHALVKELISKGVDLEMEFENYGSILLNNAASPPDLMLFKLLLDSGANPNHLVKGTFNGDPPLSPLWNILHMLKLFQDGSEIQVEMVRLLLEAGAKPENGRCVPAAIFSLQFDLVFMLEKKGFKCNWETIDSLVTFLAFHNFAVDEMRKSLQERNYSRSRRRDPQLVYRAFELALQRGLDPSKKWDGDSLLAELAYRYDSPPGLAALLLKHGASLEDVSSSGANLHYFLARRKKYKPGVPFPENAALIAKRIGFTGSAKDIVPPRGGF